MKPSGASPRNSWRQGFVHAQGISEKDEVGNSCANPHQAKVSNEEEFVRERLAFNPGGADHLILLAPFRPGTLICTGQSIRLQP